MYTRDEVLDKLIAAGLGDIEQPEITPEQFERAMAGEVVIPQKARGPAPGAEGEKCPLCSGPRERRSWRYCRKCRSERYKMFRRKRPYFL